MAWTSRNDFVDLRGDKPFDMARKIGETAARLAKELCKDRDMTDISHSVLAYAQFDFAVVTVIGREKE